MNREDFYVEQKLELPKGFEEKYCGCDDFLLVTGLHERLNIVHYSLNKPNGIDGMTMHSGMHFHEAVEYKK